jgi:hypothetical protein
MTGPTDQRERAAREEAAQAVLRENFIGEKVCPATMAAAQEMVERNDKLLRNKRLFFDSTWKLRVSVRQDTIVLTWEHAVSA